MKPPPTTPRRIPTGPTDWTLETRAKRYRMKLLSRYRNLPGFHAFLVALGRDDLEAGDLMHRIEQMEHMKAKGAPEPWLWHGKRPIR